MSGTGSVAVFDSFDEIARGTRGAGLVADVIPEKPQAKGVAPAVRNRPPLRVFHRLEHARGRSDRVGLVFPGLAAHAVVKHVARTARGLYYEREAQDPVRRARDGAGV